MVSFIEPAILAVLGVGLLLLAGFFRSKKKKIL